MTNSTNTNVTFTGAWLNIIAAKQLLLLLLLLLLLAFKEIVGLLTNPKRSIQ